MSTPSIVHSTFVVERTYPVSAARVFAAFADPRMKRRWFVEGEGWVIDSYEADFRVGGRESSRFHPQGGPPMTYEAAYQDIVEEKRIVFTYVMTLDGRRISASLASVELFPSGRATRLVYTEQGQFFDGADQPRDRERGCRELYEKLAAELQRG